MNISVLIRPEEFKVNQHSPALIQSSRKITFRELDSLVNKTISFLCKEEIKENNIVTILSENNFEFIITILALWEIGAIPVPLNSKLLEEELNEQVKFLNSRLTIKNKEFRNISLSSEGLTIPFYSLPEYEEKISSGNFSKEKTALILFTSGSSGKPKAVMLSFYNLIQSALIGNKVLNYSNKDKWFASLPFYHIGGFSIIFRAMMFGIPIIIPDSLSYNDIKESIAKQKPTLASFVSPQLKNFVDDNFIPPKELRTVLLGGGFSDNSLVSKAIKSGWKIAKVYGSTETSSFVTFMNSEEAKKKPGASGKAVPPNEITITNEGEILVKSPVIMKSYFNNYEETSAKLKNGFYHTGDFGYLDDDGYLFVEGKREDLIVSGGENINPFEVEKIILTHSDVSEVCVIGINDEKWGQAACAAVVLKEKVNLSEDELKNFLKDKLASYKVPKKIIFIDELPKNEIGKINKIELKKIFESA